MRKVTMQKRKRILLITTMLVILLHDSPKNGIAKLNSVLATTQNCFALNLIECIDNVSKILLSVQMCVLPAGVDCCLSIIHFQYSNTTHVIYSVIITILKFNSFTTNLVAISSTFMKF